VSEDEEVWSIHPELRDAEERAVRAVRSAIEQQAVELGELARGLGLQSDIRDRLAGTAARMYVTDGDPRDVWDDEDEEE
jgi:hypothetical protein